MFSGSFQFNECNVSTGKEHDPVRNTAHSGRDELQRHASHLFCLAVKQGLYFFFKHVFYLERASHAICSSVPVVPRFSYESINLCICLYMWFLFTYFHLMKISGTTGTAMGRTRIIASDLCVSDFLFQSGSDWNGTALFQFLCSSLVISGTDHGVSFPSGT